MQWSVCQDEQSACSELLCPDTRFHWKYANPEDMWFGPASTVVNSSDRVQSALQLLCHSTVRNLRAMDVWIVFLEEPVPFNSNYKSLPSFNSENDVFKSNIMKWHSQCSWLATNFKAIVFSRVCSFKIFWDPIKHNERQWVLFGFMQLKIAGGCFSNKTSQHCCFACR